MGEELEFRTAVGGYKKDDVLEYVENMNDKLSQMSRAHEEERDIRAAFRNWKSCSGRRKKTAQLWQRTRISAWKDWPGKTAVFRMP